MRENSLLEEQYGFVPYYESKRREGWLLNYNTITSKDGVMKTKLYLIDERCVSFLVTVPYFPSFLLKTSDCDAVEEYFKRKYVGDIESIKRVTRVDFREYNHLNKLPGVFLEIRFRTEPGFSTAVRNTKQTIAKNQTRRNDDADYSDFLEGSRSLNAEEYLQLIGEYDIPVEISVANELGIRSGKWYGFRYTGEGYVIEKSEKIVFPDLRILAFDIETFKKPLKFPNPESDEVMMISIKTECGGELITNRNLVSKDIEAFEYSPKADMQCAFDISNEKDEEALLIRFIEVVQRHRPHLITTFNGAFFDFPFLEKRLLKYGMSLEETIGFACREEYYESPFIVHLDCYKWVKRDSYLPAGSQGLKAVTKAKLGYFPDEVDPEDMVELANTDPDRMASYSVSDAVATYFLYVKYVQPHVFSICSLIPLPPTSVLCQGSGTLCEALLISEAVSYNAFVPEKRREDRLREYNGHIVESMTYVGGHVECLKAGIFRSDFEYDFKMDEAFIEMVMSSLDDMLSEYRTEDNYEDVKASILKNLQGNVGNIRREGSIYHLDVGAMYPNIILTNKLQPISIVNDDICIRCDFSDDSNKCKRRMDWVLKVEYIPPGREEVEMIKNQVLRESFGSQQSYGRGLDKKLFSGLSSDMQSDMLKSRVREYSRKIYKKLKTRENSLQSSTVCQREVPFYVETVRKFRDQRYIYKKLQSDATKALERAGTDEERVHARKSIVVYSSLQIAHKCVLNSFYGYVMRKSSRWYSMEMAAIVCNIGGNIIRKAKDVVEKIGISLELDTDGIWCIVPSSFKPSYTFSSGKKVSFLADLLNYFVCRDFTNDQYQEKIDGKYVTRTENSIFFEIDGPYRAMLLPASTEESKLLKKRYAIINDDNTIAELKGFEIKRRGELEIIKKLQEELFLHFLDGNTLGECYEALSEVCNYWLDIVRSKGEYLDDETIMELLSESRSMSKEFTEYDGKKSNLTTTASRMSEFLGEGILEEKLKCEYIVASYPENKSVADRTIPVMIFRSEDRDRFLERWLGREYPGDIRAIIDWNYYRSRLECVVQKMIILPALSQGVKNPLGDIKVPSWALKQKLGLGELKFRRIDDIEDVISDRTSRKKDFGVASAGNLKTFFSGVEKDTAKVKETFAKAICGEDSMEVRNKKSHGIADEEAMMLLKMDVAEYICKRKDSWMRRVEDLSIPGDVAKLSYTSSGELNVYYTNRTEPGDKIPLERTIYMQINSWTHFEESKEIQKMMVYLSGGEEPVEVAAIRLKEYDFVANHSLYKKFFSHFSIKRVFEDRIPISYGNIRESNGLPIDYIIITSFMFQNNVVYAVGREEPAFISSGQSSLYELRKYVFRNVHGNMIIVINGEDPNKMKLEEVLGRFHILEVSVKVYASLDGYKKLCSEQKKLHQKIEKEVNLLCEASRYTRIPILNINKELLDILLYREMKTNNVVCDISGERYYRNGLKTEKFRPGLYGSYSIEFECVGTLVLSIIEHKTFLGEDTLFGGIMRKDFCILRNFLKKLVLDSIRGVEGTRVLLRDIVSWIKKDSRIISEELRGICCLLQQKYIIHLAGRLKEHDYRVISVGRDIISVDTGKASFESVDIFFQHLSRKISTFPGYEMMKIRMIRRFRKLAFVSPSSYFFVEDGEYFCFSMFKIPTAFLRNYFESDEVDHDLVYRVISQVSVDSAKTILELLSFKTDTQSLRSNCCKLLHLNEFETKKTNDLALEVTCPTCGAENTLRYKCMKCYKPYPRETVLDVASAHLKYLLWMELTNDSYCDKCGGINEMRLSDFCKCGGVFKKKQHWDDVNKLRELADNKVLDHLCDMVSDHFSK